MGFKIASEKIPLAEKVQIVARRHSSNCLAVQSPFFSANLSQKMTKYRHLKTRLNHGMFVLLYSFLIFVAVCPHVPT